MDELYVLTSSTHNGKSIAIRAKLVINTSPNANPVNGGWQDSVAILFIASSESV